MKMFKSLLLGSAAGVLAVAGAQAADLPVKAKPVEYVKICNLYGDGFYYVPGTDTCVRIGGNVRIDYYYNDTGGQQPLYFANGFNAAGGARDRLTSSWAQRGRADLGLDSRTQTSYGTLRTVTQIRIDNLDQGTVNPSLVRAFIQWSGFTFGRARSLHDPEGMPGGGGGFTFVNQFQMSSDTVGAGANQLAYTWELGNGMTLSTGFEERRVKALVNLNQNTAMAANASPPTIFPGTAANTSREGMNFPNPWVAFRVSQEWGSASAAVVGNYNGGTYYGGIAGPAAGSQYIASPTVVPACTDAQQTVGGVVTIAGTSLCNHPSDKWGWAFLSGIMIRLPFIAQGDRFGMHFQYGVGASAYGGGSNIQSPALFGKGNTVALGVVTDGVYCTPPSQATAATAANAVSCTGNIEQTTAWAIGAGFEHWWTPAWVSKIYAQYGEHNYNANVVRGGWLCGNDGSGIVRGTGATTNAQPNALIGGIVSNGGNGACDPSFNMKQVAAQLSWFPGGGLQLSAEVMYTSIGTAFGGQTVVLNRFNNGALGVLAARPSGTYTATDQNILSAALRVQKGFGGVGGD